MKKWLLACFLLASATAALAQSPAMPTGPSTGAGYPLGSTVVNNVTTGADTASATVTIPGAAGRLSFACGFNINGLGSTAGSQVTATIGTLANPAAGVSLSFAYVFPAGAAVSATPVGFTFSPCVPASAVGAAITLTVPGSAGNTSTNLNIWGYQVQQ